MLDSLTEYLLPAALTAAVAAAVVGLVAASGGRHRVFYFVWRYLAPSVDERLSTHKDALFKPYRESVLQGTVVEIGAGLGHGIK